MSRRVSNKKRTTRALELHNFALKDLSADTPLGSVPSVKSPVFHFFAHDTKKYGRRYQVFQGPEYDLVEVGKVADTESFVAQAYQKKTALMFKEGFNYVGKNPERIEYIKTRFKQIAQATGIPHEELVRRIGAYLIRTSNAILVRVRDRETSGGRVRIDERGREIEPIAGYFPAPPETMEVAVDAYGHPRLWRQLLPSGLKKEFAPPDVVHFHFNRKEGFLYGTPTLTPVISDIISLRRIEQEVELLVHHHLFPLLQLVVGTDEAPAGITDDGKREIDVAKTEIEDMPLEGMIVTPHRYRIEAIGSESRALRVEGYLEHFKKRVIAGLGMSSVDFGDADTANRSTSETMSLAMVDGVKDVQDILESQFNTLIINELLLESTFGDDVLSEENVVRLEFREIDLDKQVKMEAHYADQFAKKVITWDELRVATGRQPILFPAGENEEHLDPKKFRQWQSTYWKLFEEPALIIKAVDEPFSGVQAAVGNPNTSLKPEEAEAARKQRLQELQAQLRARRSNARKGSDSFSISDAFLTEPYLALQEKYLSLPDDQQLLRGEEVFLKQRAIHLLQSRMFASFVRQYPMIGDFLDLGIIGDTRRLFSQRASLLVGRLFKDVTIQIGKKPRVPSYIRSVFSALEYRVRFIEDVELRKAGNWGILLWAELRGEKAVRFSRDDSDHVPCAKCLQSGGIVLKLDTVGYQDIPPHHAYCVCPIMFVAGEELSKKHQDAAIEEADGDKLERCVLKVKQQLRRKNPKISEDGIKRKAFAICNAAI